MNESQYINYQRIAEAINYIQENFKRQPSLEEIAEQVHLSPFHFQRMFSEWAGVSPKKFMQFLSVEYAKQLLQGMEATLFEAAQETGLSGTGRLHDLFVKIEGMTPGEFKNGGEKLQINYSFAESPFGEIIVASTSKGICHLAFFSDRNEGETTMKARFPNASYHQLVDSIQQEALFIFQHDWNKLNQIKLHLHGTPFQLKVWDALLRIPMGNLTTYGSIAGEIEKPKASRAIGTAIGSNPVAFLIPCHRVIQSSGKLGGYMWGTTRKSAIIGWEAAQLNAEH
ncbi:AraC family transcriptional regulator, regulatory protein of adaptative response / methylated-DNA-[protein]-cysteine methyltransferase [Algoriphagus locisalis]|uniref:methylated-DNA--[protein]-cysteine S-methyltransferase n=1 Tax=Algoriphagus locisalis TaxID=305507 RepID=A0A1I7BRP8_9BACT|nr:methylated-DNA--[protein]-cysteine S-methyltransferase [Algoriphagus locisalis]SFT89864.1 AraC family transcriptional regulator, regulatory protein of adaptative response / methylated-DNA-[protein]-cysteine methyltransferase [Algoriphagus locisalis]